MGRRKIIRSPEEEEEFLRKRRERHSEYQRQRRRGERKSTRPKDVAVAVNFCAASNCKNQKYTNTSFKFFKFPQDEDLSRTWLLLCGRKELCRLSGEQLGNYRLCSAHFAPEMKVGDNLTPDAVPTLFPEKDAWQSQLEDLTQRRPVAQSAATPMKDSSSPSSKVYEMQQRSVTQSAVPLTIGSSAPRLVYIIQQRPVVQSAAPLVNDPSPTSSKDHRIRQRRTAKSTSPVTNDASRSSINPPIIHQIKTEAEQGSGGVFVQTIKTALLRVLEKTDTPPPVNDASPSPSIPPSFHQIKTEPEQGKGASNPPEEEQAWPPSSQDDGTNLFEEEAAEQDVEEGENEMYEFENNDIAMKEELELDEDKDLEAVGQRIQAVEALIRRLKDKVLCAKAAAEEFSKKTDVHNTTAKS